MAHIDFDRFVSPTYQLTNAIDEVPQLGNRARERLAANNIVSTYQLIAHYLELRERNDALEAFKAWLIKMEAPSTHAGRIANAIATRVTTVGIKLEHIQLSDKIMNSSRLDVNKSREIAARTFNNQLEHDFEGCGFGKPGAPSGSVKAYGTTDKLIAAFLNKFDAPPTAAMADAFYAEMSKVEGFKAHGYKSTIIEAIKIRLSVGIDRVVSRYEPELPAMAEATEPSTPDRSRPTAAAATTPVTGGTQRARTRPAQNPSAPYRHSEAARALPTHGMNTPLSQQEARPPSANSGSSAKGGGMSQLLVLAIIGVAGAVAYAKFAGSGDVEM